MDLRLAGHGALVTGSSAGIGAAIAETLAGEGCDVLVHGRDAAAAAAVAEQVAAHGVRAEVVLGDLTEPGVAEQVAVTARDFGARILVNSAGPFAEHDWETSGPADWRAAFEGNVLPTVRVTQTLLPSLRQHGWGRVITIGSRAQRTPPHDTVTYSAARAAVVNMTTSLAHHLAGTGVTANCVSPGIIVTDEERIDGSAGERPGRPGRPEDIAAAVAYLASPLADYVNGIELRVDGGITGSP
ncbi:SDR family NAD(P)-dependent oxidoreductase [Streptomyces sp. NPDC101227]|uniref:SDR family NAD(P)-dependent oxidoreductase n=1 Tax=Streptomyces sp. NPDC101227 TaxID=3366136 RepID=UPI00381A032D